MGARIEGVVRVERTDAALVAVVTLLCGGCAAIVASGLIFRSGAPPAAGWFGSVMAVSALVILVAGGIAWRRVSRSKPIAVERDGVRVGNELAAWGDVSVDGDRSGLTVLAAGTRVRLVPERVANWNVVAQALRQRIEPTRWRVREAEVQPLSRAARVPHRAQPPPTTYRAPSGPSIEALPPWLVVRRTAARVIALGSIAMIVGITAGIVGRPRAPVRAVRTLVLDADTVARPPVLLALGAACALAGLVGLGVGWWSRQRDGVTQRLLDWLGDGARADSRGHALSADGSRRIWLADDAIGISGIVLEQRDEHGVVQRTRTLPIDAARRDAVRTRRVARVTATSETRHVWFAMAGSNERPLGTAAVLVLDERDDGVLLTRFTDTREWAGSTWHAGRADAERQIEDEYGARDLPWREAPLDGGAISFFAYA